MEAKFINPILNAMVSTMKTMIQVDVKPGIPTVKKDSISKGDITGIMSLLGPKAKISIAMTFPLNVIQNIADKMLPPDAAKTTGALADLVGEINNIITGGRYRYQFQFWERFDSIFIKDDLVCYNNVGIFASLYGLARFAAIINFTLGELLEPVPI